VTASTPLQPLPLPPVQDAVFNVSQGPDTTTQAPGSMRSGLAALIEQLQALDGAVRALFTATDRTREWFERIQADPRWGTLVAAASMGLAMLAHRFSSYLYKRGLVEQMRRAWDENHVRVQRMFDGDWREKVRYLLWTNGQRRERALRAQGQAQVTLAGASGWG
jgi:hypothetical protein